MLASKLRPVSRRVGVIASNAKGCLPKAISANATASSTKTSSSNSSSTAVRFISTEQQQHFQQLGMLDDQGLTIFDTLHEMQVNSCQVYKENELFGTYDEASNSFLYMTYEEYNQKVNQCRSLLKDLGKNWTKLDKRCRVRVRANSVSIPHRKSHSIQCSPSVPLRM